MGDKPYKCPVCGSHIPKERIEFLETSGFDHNQFFCVKHSQIKPRQGIYLGEPGTSELLQVRKVFDDSVASVFSTPEDQEETGETE